MSEPQDISQPEGLDDEIVEDLEAPAESQEQVAGGMMPVTCGACLDACGEKTNSTD